MENKYFDLTYDELMLKLEDDIRLHIEKNNFHEVYAKLPEYTNTQLSTYVFVNETFFNHGTRNYHGDELWLLTLKNLLKMNNKNFFLYGFITLLSYRMMDDFNSREFILDYLYVINRNFLNKSEVENSIASRWIVSSSNVLGTAELMTNNIEKGKIIFTDLLSHAESLPYTPLYMMNFCQIHFQLGMIYSANEELSQSITHFEKCFLNSRAALDEISHPRNDWFLNMFSDCATLLELMRNAAIAINILNKKNNRDGTRFLSMDINPSHTFDGMRPLRRFNNANEVLKSWHINTSKTINQWKTLK